MPPKYGLLRRLPTSLISRALWEEIWSKSAAWRQASEDTHGVPMKPSYVPMMNRADLLIETGFGLEHAFLPALLEASKNPRIQNGSPGYVDCAKGVMPP